MPVDTEKPPMHTCCVVRSILSRQLLLDVLILSIVCLPVTGLFFWGTPYSQGFYCDDQSLHYPHGPETISNPVLMVVGLALPLALLMFTELYRAASQEKSVKNTKVELLTGLKGYGFFLFGTMVTKTFTEVIKFSVGRLRPNFFDVCKPDFSQINCSAGFVTEFKCTNTELSYVTVRESMLSFPSGHASFAMFSAVYTVLYLQKRFHIKSTHLLKPTIQSGLVLLSLWCGVTRINNYKHFASDVTAGNIGGAFMAFLTFYKVALPHLQSSKQTVRFQEVHRSYSVNSDLQTPAPLLRNSKEYSGIFLRDPVEKEGSIV